MLTACPDGGHHRCRCNPIPGERVRGLPDVVDRRWPFVEQSLAGPANRRDLRDTRGVSRSTSYEAVRALEENGLVERTATPRSR